MLLTENSECVRCCAIIFSLSEDLKPIWDAQIETKLLDSQFLTFKDHVTLLARDLQRPNVGSL